MSFMHPSCLIKHIIKLVSPVDSCIYTVKSLFYLKYYFGHYVTLLYSWWPLLTFETVKMTDGRSHIIINNPYIKGYSHLDRVSNWFWLEGAFSQSNLCFLALGQSRSWVDRNDLKTRLRPINQCTPKSCS